MPGRKGFNMGEQKAAAVMVPPDAAGEAKKKEIARFTKKRGRKKKAILMLAALAAAGGALWYFSRPRDTAMPVSVTELSRGELVRQVSLTGRLESEEAVRVYSTQTALVNAVEVRVGDRVEKGDLLAELDTADLVRDIAAQQKTLARAARESELNLSMTREDYDNMLRDLADGSYTDLVRAEQALTRAQKKYTEARSDFEDHRDELDHADEEYDYLDRQMTRTKIAMDKAENAYDAAKREGDAGKIADAKKAFEEKEAAYNEARDKWEKAYDDKDEVYDPITIAYRDARLSYLEALEDKKLADRDAERALETLKKKLELGELDQDLTVQRLELEKLQKNFSECTVKAPAAGVVTAVYAKEGMPGSGLLFVIEDTDRLVVKTEVKEYDVASLREGMKSSIKSDALGDRAFAGEVSRIAPAALKDANGETKTEGSASYETEIALLEPGEGLRVGMKVRLNVIIERKEGVLSVPYEAVTTDPDGNSIVYVLREEQGTADSGDALQTVARAVRVSTGMETDFSLEISSEELREGDRVISDPTGLSDGLPVSAAPVTAG